MAFGRDAEGFGDFESFLFVDAEDYLETALEIADELKGAGDVFVRAFFGVGEVEEKFAARTFDGGTGFVVERFPDLGHVRDHGPVHKGNEVGAGEMLEESVAAESFADVVPGDLGER